MAFIDPDDDSAPSGFVDPDATSRQPKGPVKIGREAFGDIFREELLGKDWATRNIIGAGSALSSAWEGIKGLAGQSDPTQVQATKIIAEEAPVGRIAGEVAMLAPTMAIPGAATARGAALIGGTTGAVLTPGDLKERAFAAGAGAAGGALGAKLSNTLAKQAPIGPSQAVRTMEQEGVGVTPGVNIGGLARRFEDRLTSVPFLGDVIERARIRNVEDFNKAALRRAQLPGSQVGDDIGGGALQTIRGELGDAYENVLKNARVDALDPQFVGQLNTLRQGVQNLPAQEAKVFDNILDREISQRLAPNGQLSATNLQQAMSGLRNEAGKFAQSTDAYQRSLGDALKQAGSELMDLVRKSNPKVAEDLKKIDAAYGNFKIAQKAATSLGSNEGVFTPAQLMNAIKAADKSKDKRAFSEGTARMQGLAAAGKETLLSKIPDSGTASRLMGTLNPLSIASMPAGLAMSIPASVLYSRQGQKTLSALVNKGIRPTAEVFRKAMASNPEGMALLYSTVPRVEQQ
jgi:hypothetical protein